MLRELRELEDQLRTIFGAWNHYRLRLWQQCRSIDAAGIVDRIKIAQEVLAAPHRGDWVWALGGWHMLLSEIHSKLNDSDPHIRADAIFALAEFANQGRGAVPILLERLGSGTLHDRTLAAWALPQIGADENSVSIFLAVLDETRDQPDAGELRRCAAEAIESLADSFRVLVPLARRCLRDRSWKCRLHGVLLVERLVQRERRLWSMLVPNVEPLVCDEVGEVREVARRIMIGFEEVE